MTSNITWLLTEAEKAVEKFREQNTDTEENKTNYHYWQDQVGFFEKCIDQHHEMNKLFHDLQALETRLGMAYLIEKEIHNGKTVACQAISDAHDDVQRAKTAVGFAHTGD